MHIHIRNPRCNWKSCLLLLSALSELPDLTRLVPINISPNMPPPPSPTPLIASTRGRLRCFLNNLDSSQSKHTSSCIQKSTIFCWRIFYFLMFSFLLPGHRLSFHFLFDPAKWGFKEDVCEVEEGWSDHYFACLALDHDGLGAGRCALSPLPPWTTSPIVKCDQNPCKCLRVKVKLGVSRTDRFHHLHLTISRSLPLAALFFFAHGDGGEAGVATVWSQA